MTEAELEQRIQSLELDLEKMQHRMEEIVQEIRNIPGQMYLEMHAEYGKALGSMIERSYFYKQCTFKREMRRMRERKAP